jgi:DNA-binding NarL/FixJ family response regulator
MNVAGEFDSLAAARASAVDSDAILVAPDSPAPDEDGFDEALTGREVQVLELLAEGLPNKAIAARLGISDQTVKFHVSSISGKLGARNRTDAVRRAARRGLITL